MAEYIDTPFAKTAILVFCFNGLVHSLAWLALFQSAIGRYPLYKNEASHKKLKEGIRQTFYGFVAYIAICLLAFWYPVVALCLVTASWLGWVIVGLAFSDREART